MDPAGPGARSGTPSSPSRHRSGTNSTHARDFPAYARPIAERGQASVEWIALVFIVALVVAAVAAVALHPAAATDLARSLVGKVVCAIRLDDACEEDPELVAEYGAEIAALVRAHAPDLLYEQGMEALPVDFRSCREPVCANGAEAGLVRHSAERLPAVAFVHVVACTSAPSRTGASPYRCSGERAGNVYVQYWFYYPDSATLRDLPGDVGTHPDDWESYQVRVETEGDAFVRASSHHGYNYELGRTNWVSDAGIGPLRDAAEAVGLRERGGWGPETGVLLVSGGSHAGNAKGGLLRITRATRGEDLELVPIEPLARGPEGATAFAIAPPWRKAVYRDPEDAGT